MMNNLFNQFDPVNFSIEPKMMIFLMILITLKKSEKSKLMLIPYKIMSTTSSSIKESMNLRNASSFMKIMSSLFLFVFLMNINSLTPYMWSNTSQPSVNLSMILTVWMVTMLMNMKNKPKHMMIHMTPFMTPSYLILMINLIELISLLIRPLTLILRLTANMISGHILVHLISESMVTMNMKKVTTIQIAMFMMNFMEMMVSLIQAYVVVVLLNMYLNEV